MEHFKIAIASNVRKGEYCRRINLKGEMQGKTYIRGDYDRASKSYSLIDAEDTNREIWVKARNKLAVGFTY